MQYLDAALAFAAFAGLCVFFNRCCGIAGGRTPLLSTACVILWLTVSGVAGVLRLGGWLLYLACLALGVLALVPAVCLGKSGLRKKRKAAPALFDPAFCFFLAVSLVTLVVFAVRRPVFAEWDEMSFWGTACKLVKQDDALYTTAQIGWDWVGAQQPGAILMGYFFQFFGEFAPWKTFVGYNVLMYSAFAAVISAAVGDEEPAATGWRRYPLCAAAALLCVLAPYLITEYQHITDVTNIYMSSYGDIPSGVAAGGAAAWYFAARRAQREEKLPTKSNRVLARGMWGIFPILAAVGLIKENAFPVILVSAGVVAADVLFFEKGRLWKRFAAAAGALAAPMAAYLFWSRHISAVVALRESTGEVGATNLSVFQVVVIGLKQTLIPSQRSETFVQVWSDMMDAFLHTRMTLFGSLSGSVLSRVLGEENALIRMVGSGACVAVLLLGLFALAAVLNRDKVQRGRTILAAVLSTLGFAAYYWMLILSYAFIFRPDQSAGLSDYNRYVCTYYLFWFLLALVHLVCAARTDRPRTALTGVMLATALAALLAVSRMVAPETSVLGYPDSFFDEQNRYAQVSQQLKEQITEEGVEGDIFYVGTDDIGIRYFNYCYHLLPQLTDYSYGGGPIGPPELDDGSLYYHAKTLEELTDYMAQQKIAYVFLDHYDEVFRSEYAALFTDGLAAADAGQTQLYVRVQEGDAVLFAPCGGDAA